MEIQLSDDHKSIQENVKRICDGFGDDYWSNLDQTGNFPHEFHRALADAGWLGITMPEHLGGSGLGVTEAAIMMNTITQSAGGYSAAAEDQVISIEGINLVGAYTTDAAVIQDLLNKGKLITD